MKTIFLFLQLIIGTTLFAQQPLTVDAGMDQIICSDINLGIDTTIIGGQTSATGGVPPYTYSWSFTYSIASSSNITIYASDILNDTTLANPEIIGSTGENKPDLPQMALTVMDANGNTASDSIRLFFSQFAMTLGGSYQYYIEQGDSVLCSYADVFGGIGTPTYLWSPNIGLIDSTNYSFWANPDTTTAYTMTIKDSVGCSQTGQEGIVVVNVFPLGIEEDNPDGTIKIYPNPASDYVQIEFANFSALKGDEFILFDILGSEVIRTSIQSNPQQMDVSHLAKGNYSYRIGNLSGKIVLK